MMRTLYPCFLFLLLALLPGPLSAQDLTADLSAFYRSFAVHSAIECELRSGALSKNDRSEVFSRSVRFTIDKTQCHYTIGDMTYLLNARYAVLVDKGNKRITVSQSDSKALEKTRQQLISQADTSTFRMKGQVVYDGVTDGMKKYRVLHPDKQTQQVNISFSAATGQLRKIELVFEETSKTGVASSYTEIVRFNTRPSIAPGLFDESQFITVVKGAITPAAAYRDYQLIVSDPSQLDPYNLH